MTLALFGCAVDRFPPQLSYDVVRGEYDRPLTYLENRVDELGPLWHGPLNRNDLLDRYHLGVVAMAADETKLATQSLTDVFEMLAMHGVNRDKYLSYVLINESVRVWKGEPFEQAMAFYYTGLAYAAQGSWDNLRATTLNSLYHLEDYDLMGQTIDPDELERRAHRIEQGLPVEPENKQKGYVPIKTDFALGYLMAGIANQQMGRDDEAQYHWHEAEQWAPQIKPTVDSLQRGEYNIILAVDYGLGPRKVGVGPDGAIVQFRPRTPSDDQPLLVTIDGASQQFYAAADLNVMADNHKWNRYEAMRLAKSAAGNIIIAGGAVAASSDDRDAQLAGLGLILAGLYAKANARADLRYCEVLPQRVYVAPLQITTDVQAQLQVGSAYAHVDLSPPQDGAQLIYIRLADQAMIK